MPPPMYVKNLIALLREVGGWEQQQLAEKLGVTPGAVSMWATGRRPIPQRHLRPLMQLVLEEVHRHESTRQDELNAYIHAWDVEMYSATGALGEVIQLLFEELKSPYAKVDPFSIPHEERARLRNIARLLLLHFDYIEALDRPTPPRDFEGRLGLPPWNLQPEELLRTVGQFYAVEIFQREEE